MQHEVDPLRFFVSGSRSSNIDKAVDSKADALALEDSVRDAQDLDRVGHGKKVRTQIGAIGSLARSRAKRLGFGARASAGT